MAASTSSCWFGGRDVVVVVVAVCDRGTTEILLLLLLSLSNRPSRTHRDRVRTGDRRRRARGGAAAVVAGRSRTGEQSPSAVCSRSPCRPSLSRPAVPRCPRIPTTAREIVTRPSATLADVRSRSVKRLPPLCRRRRTLRNRGMTTGLVSTYQPYLCYSYNITYI